MTSTIKFATPSMSHAAWFVAAVMSCAWLVNWHHHEHTKALLRSSQELAQQAAEELRRLSKEADDEQHWLELLHEELLSAAQEQLLTVQDEAAGHELVAAAAEVPSPDAKRQLQVQNGSWDGPWRILGDGCEYSPDDSTCIQTVNHPDFYPPDSVCAIEIPQNATYGIFIESWDVELHFDFLTINGRLWQNGFNVAGPSRPPLTNFPEPGSFITWQTSWKNERPGWKMCRRATCGGFSCPSGYGLKINADTIICASDVCDEIQDRAACCERRCEAPSGLDAMYTVSDNCTAGSLYSVAECTIGCASGYDLDGTKPPQKCQDDGTFSLPTCIAMSPDSTYFPWVIFGDCQLYGRSCVSSIGVGGTYRSNQQCLITVDTTSLPKDTSEYLTLFTHLQLEDPGDQYEPFFDRLIRGVQLELVSCDEEGWTCHNASSDDAIPSHAWSTSMDSTPFNRAGPGTTLWQGPNALEHMLWTTDSKRESGTGWIVCAESSCGDAMNCPPGYRFVCESAQKFCYSHNCVLPDDVKTCCDEESEDDFVVFGSLPGEARNASWCETATYTTTTTTATPWVFDPKPDIVGHLVLVLTDRPQHSEKSPEIALREALTRGLLNIGSVPDSDVQVGLNISDDAEPVSTVAFRVEHTDVLMEQLAKEDFIEAFNAELNETMSLVKTITYSAVKSTISLVGGDRNRRQLKRGYNSGCREWHYCDANNPNWNSCWQDRYAWSSCGAINHRHLCGLGTEPGPGWDEWYAGLRPGRARRQKPFTYQEWATELTVGKLGYDPILTVSENCCACGGGRCTPGFFRMFAGAPTFCMPCPAGSTSLEDDPRNCTSCGPGTFAPELASPECSLCPAGRYSNEESATECMLCAPGLYSTSEGMTDCTEACPRGTSPSPDHSECVPCAAGKVAADDGMDECEPCPAGEFQSEVGATACELCPAATFTGSTGRADCDSCRPGTYSTGLGVSACVDCPLGQAQALSHQTACVDCKPAFYAHIEGLSECLLCDAGTESDEHGTVECTPCARGWAKPADALNCSLCAPGTFASVEGRSECRQCPVGQRANAFEGADGCEDCEAGTYGPVQGATACIECSLGHFGMEDMMSACVECEIGSFSNVVGLTECAQCTPGTYAAVSGHIECDKCDPGFHAQESGAVSCIRCEAGTYAEAEGTAVCPACSKGNFSPQNGLTSCVLCQPGRYAAAQGMDQCSMCELGTYAEAEGSSGCEACNNTWGGLREHWITMRPPTDSATARPSGVKAWIELPGASHWSSCGCKPGMQFRNGACEGCGEGLTCLGMNVTEVLKGYAWDGGYSTWDCTLGIEEACPGGMLGTCMPGRDAASVACAACLPELVPAEDGSCTECKGGDLALPVVAAIITLTLATGLYCYFDYPKEHRPRLSYLLIVVLIGQAITMVQQLGIISLIQVDWSEPVLSVFDRIASIVFFDLFDLRVGCVADMDAPGQYLMRLCFVFFCFLVVIFAHGVSQVLQHRHDWKTRWPSLWCALGTILLACMVSIVSTMLVPMKCSRHPNGKQTVRWYPTILCWEGGDHTRMVVQGIVACLVPLTFLAASFWAVCRYPKKLMKSRTYFLSSWAFLFFRYKPEAYWYGPVMMLRNCLISAIPILTTSVLQIVFLKVLIVFSLVLLLYVMPWRVKRANDLDAVGHLCLLLVTMLAAFFAKEDNLDFISTLAMLFVCALPAALLALIVYTVCLVIAATFRKFQFFLCHHKQGAGCFCRLVKMWLLRTSGVTRKDFIDSDDLRNLDSLFDVVAHSTDTLVAVHSQHLLTRPWCIGELTTAHRSGVRIVRLCLHGIEAPTIDFITNFATYVPDIASIEKFGIQLDMVDEALRAFGSTQAYQLPQELHDKTLERLCLGLASLRDVHDIGSANKRQPNATKPQGVIIANKLDSEAAATALILCTLLNPLLQNQDNSLSYVLAMDETIDPNVRRGFLVCTNGAFTEHVVTAIMACKVNRAVVLPIMSVTNFIFPSMAWMETQEVFKKMPEASNTVQALFSEIAVDFQPSALSGTEATLHTKAVEITNRILGGMATLKEKVSSLEVKLVRAVTVLSNPSRASERSSLSKNNQAIRAANSLDDQPVRKIRTGGVASNATGSTSSAEAYQAYQKKPSVGESMAGGSRSGPLIEAMPPMPAPVPKYRYVEFDLDAALGTSSRSSNVAERWSL